MLSILGPVDIVVIYMVVYYNHLFDIRLRLKRDFISCNLLKLQRYFNAQSESFTS